jgi:hypothetical protein
MEPERELQRIADAARLAEQLHDHRCRKHENDLKQSLRRE